MIDMYIPFWLRFLIVVIDYAIESYLQLPNFGLACKDQIKLGSTSLPNLIEVSMNINFMKYIRKPVCNNERKTVLIRGKLWPPAYAFI